MSSSLSSSADNGTSPQVSQLPPSGSGDTQPTAQYTTAFATNTNQTYFTVYCQLDSIKWLRCTHAEALYYKNLSYQVYKANGQTFRPPGAQVSGGENDPNAFYSHFEDIVNTERVIEAAGQEAMRDEGLMSAAINESGVVDRADASSASSGSSGDVFDRPEVCTDAFPSNDKGKGNL